MNLVFVSDDSNEAKRLKDELSGYIRRPREYSPAAKDLPVELRYVTVQQIGLVSDGRLQLADSGSFSGDIIVVDSALTGDRTRQTIKDAKQRFPDIPLILLTNPEDESLEMEALNAGATDCIAKTENYFQRLFPAVEREIKYQALRRYKTEIDTREYRLRLIVENLPVGIAVLAPDGTLLSVNQAGLGLMGESQPDRIVGKNVLHFIAEEDRDRTQVFLDTVCGGSKDSIVLDWKKPEGPVARISLNGTPVERQGIQGSVALAAISSSSETEEREYVHEENRPAGEEALVLEEEKRRALEAALHESEENRRRQAEQQGAERSQWEQNVREAEEKQTAVQAALREAGNQLSAIEAALHESEENRRRQAGQQGAERSQWEQNVREAEERRASLQSNLLTEQEKRAELEAALRKTEEDCKKLSEELEGERARSEQNRLEWEKKLKEANEQNAIHLQNTVRELEDRHRRLSEENEAKDAQLKEIREDLEPLELELEGLQVELTEENERYRRLSQLFSAGVLVTTKEGRVSECNDAAARMFGYTSAGEALSQADRENIFRIYSFKGSLGELLQRKGALENVQWASLSRDGRVIRLKENAVLVKDSSGSPPRIERVLTDISRIYGLNAEIRSVREAGSKGNLLESAINNLKHLSESLTDCGRLLENSSNESETVRKVAETLLRDADFGTKHAGQILAATAKTDRAQEIVDLNGILAENDTVLHSLAGEDIELQIERSSNKSLIVADRRDIVQLLSNLVLSSLNNLPLGGNLTIGTENMDIDASASQPPEDIPSGIYVLLTVRAGGCEVCPESSTTLFQRIVDRMGGRGAFTHDIRSGNTYKIYFPRVEAFAGGAVQSPEDI